MDFDNGFKFDISKVKYEDSWMAEGYHSAYFIAPAEWVSKHYPEAVSAEIRIECRDLEHFDPNYVYVEISPTREDNFGNLEDYSWYEIVLDISEIQGLMALAGMVE